MKTGKLIVGNQLGLHLGAAASIVELLEDYEVEVSFISGSCQINARSLMDIISLAAPYGTILSVEVSGRDSEAAFLALKKLFEENFGEDD